MAINMFAAIVVLYEPSFREILNIKDYSNKVSKLIIIDNSVNNNYEMINNIISEKFEYLHFPENIGLCAAFNKGIEIASESGYKWILLMDSDSSFITNIIGIYKKEIRNINENVAVLSPVHIHERSRAKKYNGVKKVKWAMTSGCLYNVCIAEEIGGFMEDLFVDGLDIEYCYRARKKGFTIIECGEALLRHHPADTKCIKLFGKTFMKIGISSPWRYYMQARSLVYIILKYKCFSDVIRLVWKWIKVIFFFDQKKSYFSQMFKGIEDGIILYSNNK